MQRNFVADVIRLKLAFVPKNDKIAFESPFGGLRGNVRTPSVSHWKARGRLYIVIIEHFRYLLRLRRYKRKSVEVGIFRRGWITLSAYFRGKEASPTKQVTVRKLE